MDSLEALAAYLLVVAAAPRCVSGRHRDPPHQFEQPTRLFQDVLHGVHAASQTLQMLFRHLQKGNGFTFLSF